MSIYQKNKIEINNLTKSFEDKLVIKNISINVKDKEFVSILGPSGCGKSTLFNIIAGLIDADSGDVFIDNKKCNGKLGLVSYMHQKDLLLPWKKIIDNVSIPLVLKGVKKDIANKHVKKYFEIFGIKGFEHKYPYQLSGGMRQRAALLRTYMFSKNIMLLDEPFGALDAITRTKMHKWLLDIVKDLNTTVVFITHDIEEAIFLSDKIYVLSDRPCTIKKELNVDLKFPRTKDIVISKEFNEIKKIIIDAL